MRRTKVILAYSFCTGGTFLLSDLVYELRLSGKVRGEGLRG